MFTGLAFTTGKPEHHGKEYHMNKGTSYNSRGTRSVKRKRCLSILSIIALLSKFFANLEMESISMIRLAIICQHAEEDHLGALAALLAKIPNTPVYRTEAGVNSIVGCHHHQDWTSVNGKNWRHTDIGNGKQLIFARDEMLHFARPMATYPTGDEIHSVMTFGSTLLWCRALF